MTEKVSAEEIETVEVFNEEGHFQIGYQKLGPEHMETLKALNTSPHWKFYRDILIKAKHAHSNSILPLEEPMKVMKMLGIVAGINFAINQLPILVKEHERRLREEQAKQEAKASRPKSQDRF